MKTITKQEQFLSEVAVASLLRDVLRCADKSRSALTLAASVEIPQTLSPKVAAVEFVVSFYDHHSIPPWPRATFVQRLYRAQPQERRGRSAPNRRAARREESHAPTDWLMGLFDQYSPSLNALLLRMLGDTEIAEALLVEAFEHAWNEGHEAFRGPDCFVKLVELVRAFALRHLDRGDRAMERGDGEHSSSCVGELFLGITPRQRRLMEAAFFKGKTVRQLAHEWNVPRGWIRNCLNHALDQMMARAA